MEATFEQKDMQYRVSYAYWSPRMRDRYANHGIEDTAKLHYAKLDVLKALDLYKEPTSYVGKLYAELDAIRDVELRIRNRAMRASHDNAVAQIKAQRQE